MCVLPLLSLDIQSRVRGWVNMIEFLLILIILLMISITINVALLCSLYIMWVNEQI